MNIKEINNIFVCGDLHGDHDIDTLNTKNFNEQKKLVGNNIVLQVGDFGLIWKNGIDKSEKYWLKWLDKKNFFTLFIGGNHENYDRLEKYPTIDFNGGKAAQISKKVFYLKNGYIYDFDGLKFWMFGGGTSIDRMYREEGLSWWRQEIPSYKEMQFGLDSLRNNDYEVDYIITHTLPNIMIHRYRKYAFGENFEAKVKFPCPVSEYLDNVFEAMRGKYKKWSCGHFHFDKKLDENFTVLYKKLLRIK